jgi:signal transduction histidine kinase
VDPSPGISLRRATRVVLAVLCGLLALTSVAFAVGATLIHRVTHELGEGLESVRISQAMQVQLTAHSRALLFADLGGSVRYVPAVPALELSLRRLAEEAARHAQSPAEEAQVRRVRDAVAAYLEARAQLDAGPTRPSDRLSVLGPRFDAASAALDGLVWMNVDNARTWRARAAAYDQVAGATALALVLTLALALAALSCFVRRDVLRSLAELHGAGQAFSAGDEAARAPERGVRELCELSRTFNAMADTLVRWRGGAVSFQLGAAAQLRDPLTVIKLLLHQTPADGGSAQAIGKQVDRIEAILRDVIDAALIGRGELELAVERRDLGPLVAEVVAELSGLWPDRRVILDRPERPAPARVDPARLAHVVRNLLGNALEFSAPADPVSVTLTADDEHVTLAVTDQGVGMTPEALAHVFEPFQQKGVSRGLSAGAGLGLHATRAIVEAHGGRIEVESAPRRGSTFRVVLPRAADEA